MDNPTQARPGDMPTSSGAHEPFTLTERFQQLADIDNDIIKLLSLANDTLHPLSTPTSVIGSDSAGAATDFANLADSHTENQVASFKEAMDSFLTTLHSVDVRLKRQIWSLEEAGIISLKESRLSGVSLEPNGVGDIGSLDVGWLNSRSSKVDRDMEAELWAIMRAKMERIGQKEPDQRETDADK